MSIAARKLQRAAGGTTPVATLVSLWPSNPTPEQVNLADGQAIELGTKFQSTINTQVVGVRFYKGSGDTGTHTGSLWRTDDTELARVTFTGETASGWQSANFDSPVTIGANTTYIISYHSPTGTYSASPNYFASRVTNGTLVGLSSAESGGNGVFTYNTSPAMPNSVFSDTNYWVDVVTSTTAISDTTPPSTPTGLATSVYGMSVTLTWTASTDNFSVTSYNVYRDGINVGSSGSTSYTDSATTADTTYSYRVQAVDGSGNTSAQSAASSATTGSGGTITPTSFQDFTAATWGSNAGAKTSSDGVWKIAGDWIGTGGNTLLAANGTIDFSGTGTLSLLCNAKTSAAEIQSLPTYGHGYYECRMKVGKIAGTCQSFFLIGDGYGPGEIDFEFLTGGDNGTWLNTSTGAVMINVHPTNSARNIILSFNPCDAFHTYGILWTPTHIAFVVDGTVRYDWTNLPAEVGPGAEKMYVMANNWTSESAVWGGGPPAGNAIAQYDYFKVWEGATAIPPGAVGG